MAPSRRSRTLGALLAVHAGGEVGIVSGGSRGPGEEAAAGEGPRECGVGAGVTGAVI
jgi:hypothetical protein